MWLFKSPIPQRKKRYCQIFYFSSQNTRENQDNEDEIFIKETSSADDAVFIASVYERIRQVIIRLDGHQGRDAAEYICDTMFDRIAGTLLTNPEDIQTEIKTVFQDVDREYCEEKAIQLREILFPKKRCCFRTDSNMMEPRQRNLGCGCVLTLLCIHNNQLILAGLGDCGIVFSSKGHACYSLLRHNPNVGFEYQRICVRQKDRTQLQSAGGRVINNRVEDMLGVSRSIGDIWFKKSYRDPK